MRLNRAVSLQPGRRPWLPFATAEPVAFALFGIRRVREAISSSARHGVAYTRFGDVRYAVDLSLHAIARKYYFRTHMTFLDKILKAHLKPADVFIDIGAHCGYWSALSASLVGLQGRVDSFEPIPPYFAMVERLSADNPEYTIVANPLACGAKSGRASMSYVPPHPENIENFEINIASNSLVPGYLGLESPLVESTEVEVVRLDDYLREQQIDVDRIGLIKISVVGFEPEVLDGMPQVLAKPGRKVPLLIEVGNYPERNPIMGADMVFERLERYGYRACDAVTLRSMTRKTMPASQTTHVIFT